MKKKKIDADDQCWSIDQWTAYKNQGVTYKANKNET